MKKAFLLSMGVCILLFALAGCGSQETNRSEEESAFQELTDRAYIAKLFAEESFANDMSARGNDGYTIEESAYGFIASEVPTFIVAFEYAADGTTGRYGYRISVDDGHKCSVAEEGESVSGFLLDEAQ